MTNVFGKCRIILQRPNFSLDVAFDIPRNKVLGVFGESGSGKTSLLRCLAGLEKSVQGDIKMDNESWLDQNGKQLPPYERRIAYVFQDSRLFLHLSVEGNLRYGYKHHSVNIGFEQVVELLELSNLLTRKPHELSGGEQQRVAIGRALLSQPKLLLLDEPLASLDQRRKQEILPFLERLHRQIDIPIVYVSHSVEEMQRLCDEVIVLENGRVIYDDTMKNSLISEAAPFPKRENASVLLEVESKGYDKDQHISPVSLGMQTLYVASKLNQEQKISLRVLASDVSLTLTRPEQTTILNVLEAKILRTLHETEFHLTLLLSVEEQSLLARISRKSYKALELGNGAKVFAQIKAVSIHAL